jgi:hypothetical protein
LSYIASDYHADGECFLAAARDRIEHKWGRQSATTLFDTNPKRILAGAAPDAVDGKRKPWWNVLSRLT